MERSKSGSYIFERKRIINGVRMRWRFSMRTKKKREATERDAQLGSLVDSEEGRAILAAIIARQLEIGQVCKALSPGGKGIGSLTPKASDVTLAHACEAYLAGVRGRARTKATIETIARQLIAAFGERTPIARISKADAQRWLLRSGWSPKTQQYKHVYARAIFAEAKPRVNVFDEVKPQALIERTKPWLTLEETYEFLDQLDARGRAWMGCGFLAGLRMGEAQHLRWSDVDLDAMELHVRTRGGAHAWTSKSGKARVVPVEEELREWLLEWRRVKDSRCEYVFGMQQGPLSVRAAVRWTHEAYRSAGMTPGRANDGWTYHAGRHSAASNALRKGEPASVVADWIGDTVQTLMKAYSKTLAADSRSVARSLKRPSFSPSLRSGDEEK